MEPLLDRLRAAAEGDGVAQVTALELRRIEWALAEYGPPAPEPATLVDGAVGRFGGIRLVVVEGD